MWPKMSEELAQAIQRLRRRTVRAARFGTLEKKQRAAAFRQIEKKYGKNAIGPIVNLNNLKVPSVSTGFSDIDDVLTGRGARDEDGDYISVARSGRGVPRGRIIEIFGPESGGKTTFCLMVCAAYQERGLSVAYIDAEHALDLGYAARLGCDVEEWDFSQPNSGEEALNIARTLVDENAVDLIVIDSVAALTPEAEIEGDIEDQQMGVHARLMSKSLRLISRKLGLGSKTTVIFVNQTRMKIGGYGNPETTSGGNALKFYASIRLRMVKISELKKGSRSRGIRSKIRAVKNKVAMPFREVFVDITGGNGITETHANKNPSLGGGSSTRSGADDD